MRDSGGALAEPAPAKINLALHVRRRRADGYHDLESVFAFTAFGDTLTARPAAGFSLAVQGPMAGALAGEADEDNLVLRAARALADAAGIAAGAALVLEKRIPVQAGLGGGSADAAAALRVLCRLWGVNPAAVDLPAIAARLGADVPACLVSRTLRAEGRGERLAAVAAAELAGLPVLLVNPGVAVPTGPVFAAWDRQDRGALGEDVSLAALAAARNDLAEPAVRLAPAIGEVLDSLAMQPGTRLARMSGSGATCFAVFDTALACRAAATAVEAAHPHWWVQATALI